jgi:hypothetical protein
MLNSLSKPKIDTQLCQAGLNSELPCIFHIQSLPTMPNICGKEWDSTKGIDSWHITKYYIEISKNNKVELYKIKKFYSAGVNVIKLFCS